MAQQLTHNMWENLKNAALGMVDGSESIPESIMKVITDLTHDSQEMEDYGVFNINLDQLFYSIIDRVTYKVETASLERRDIWGDLNDTLHRIIGHLTGKFADLKDFFHKTIKAGAEQLKPHIGNIKKLAQDLLNNVSVVSKTVAEQALEFFKPFKAQLGDLWNQLVDRIHKRFHDIANPAIDGF